MKTNLKKLTLAIMTIALLLTMALPAAAAEIPTLYDDDVFLWDDENPLAVIEFFEDLDALMGVSIADEEVPLSAAPEAVNIPTLYDDDMFLWDDTDPFAVVNFIDGLLGE